MITVHIAGKYQEFIQKCTRCGFVICDDREAMVTDDQCAPIGFPEGPVSVEGNCTMTGADVEGKGCWE